MPNSLTGRNFDLTPPVRSYVEGKVDRLRKVFENIQKIDVILTGHKRSGEADLIVQAAHALLKCAAKDANAQAAFDVAMDKMERQLQRHKARLVGNKKHRRDVLRKARARAGEFEEAAVVPPAAEEASPVEIPLEEEALPQPRPVRLRRMSLQEAIDAFERADYGVLVYLDEESERTRILLRDEYGENCLLEVVGES